MEMITTLERLKNMEMATTLDKLQCMKIASRPQTVEIATTLEIVPDHEDGYNTGDGDRA